MYDSRKITASALLVIILGFGSIAIAEESVPNGGFMFSNNLKSGARGADVRELQRFLIAEGLLNVGSPTGYFGALTRIAMISWQMRAGIVPASGYFGPLSRAKLNNDLRATSTPLNNTASVPATTTTPVAPIVNTSAAKGLPVRIKITKLGVDAGFQYTGLLPNGDMDAPTTISEVGWYTGSARPGETGVAVLAGHVAQIRGGVATKPGVFSNLSELSVGDTIEVFDDRGVSVTFTVRATRLIDPNADSTDIFTASDNRRHLNLITCQGTWNAAEASFSKRLVIFADSL